MPSFFKHTSLHRPTTSTPSPSTSRTPSPSSSSPETSLSWSDLISESSTWDIITAPSSPPSRCHIPTSLSFHGSAPVPSNNPVLDTITFPPHASSIPSHPNGTWRTSTRHALQHPRETASSVGEACTLDVAALRSRLEDIADTASEDLTARLNRAFEGRDLIEMHHRVVGCVPAARMPETRHVSRVVDAVSDAAQDLAVRERVSSAYLGTELQGDKWAFARIMSLSARRALVRCGICWEWQVAHSRQNLGWQGELYSSLADVFTREKMYKGVAHLFEMKPVWTADRAGKVWRLELDTGLMEVSVDGERDGLREMPVCVQTGFEFLEEWGCISIGYHAGCGVQLVEDEWALVGDA